MINNLPQELQQEVWRLETLRNFAVIAGDDFNLDENEYKQLIKQFLVDNDLLARDLRANLVGTKDYYWHYENEYERKLLVNLIASLSKLCLDDIKYVVDNRVDVTCLSSDAADITFGYEIHRRYLQESLSEITSNYLDEHDIAPTAVRPCSGRVKTSKCGKRFTIKCN